MKPLINSLLPKEGRVITASEDMRSLGGYTHEGKKDILKPAKSLFELISCS